MQPPKRNKEGNGVGLSGTLVEHDLKFIFTTIHRHNRWGSSETVSGAGSERAACALLAADLHQVLQDWGIDRILDAPCGLFCWMEDALPADIQYVGVDIVDQLIHDNSYRFPHRSFLRGNVAMDPLPKADIILCRDGLVHLSNGDAAKTLLNFKRSGAEWILASHFTNEAANLDIHPGDWRAINVTQPPFLLPPPLLVIPDSSDEQRPDKALGLWRTDELPSLNLELVSLGVSALE